MALDVCDFSVRYGPVTAVREVSLTIPTGKVISVIGPNGAGKSSLIRGIMGAVPSQGKITLDGKGLSGLGAHKRVNRGISYVPDGRRVFPHMTVREHIRLAVGKGWEERWEYLVGLFPILGEKQHAMGSELSGGQQQSLSIARALAPRPQYILLDEPSIGLSPIAIGGLVEAVERLAGEGLGVLLAEQNASIALGLSHTIHVMVRGQVQRSASPEELRGTQELQNLYLGTIPDEVLDD